MEWYATKTAGWFGPFWGPAFYETTTTLAAIVAIMISPVAAPPAGCEPAAAIKFIADPS